MLNKFSFSNEEAGEQGNEAFLSPMSEILVTRLGSERQ
jgi:hypothetical protein